MAPSHTSFKDQLMSVSPIPFGPENIQERKPRDLVHFYFLKKVSAPGL